MIKIKQFREKLCDSKYVRDCGGYHSLELPDLNDKEINNFMEDKDVIDVKVNNFVARHHNNGGYNTQYALITVIYKEE